MDETISMYRRIIPPHVYTCWHTKDLPPKMKENYEHMLYTNQEMTFHLYDEDECRRSIEENFDKKVLRAYDALIPCSYKSDLWRFCILFLYGGVYIDIKYRCVAPFRLIELTEKEHFVRDIPDTCIYTALIVTKPKNDIMRRCIDHIVWNVETDYYGRHALDPTGPGLLGRFFTVKERIALPLYHKCIWNQRVIRQVIGKSLMLEEYSEYKQEQSVYQKKKYYSELWDDRAIYTPS